MSQYTGTDIVDMGPHRRLRPFLMSRNHRIYDLDMLDCAGNKARRQAACVENSCFQPQILDHFGQKSRTGKVRQAVVEIVIGLHVGFGIGGRAITKCNEAQTQRIEFPGPSSLRRTPGRLDL